MNARSKPLIVIAPKEIQQWFEITAQLTDLYLPYSKYKSVSWAVISNHC
jgi:ribonuclease Z